MKGREERGKEREGKGKKRERERERERGEDTEVSRRGMDRESKCNWVDRRFLLT